MGMKKIPKKYFIIVGIVLVFGILFYLIFTNTRRPAVTIAPFTLNVWGIESSGIFASISGAYQASRPGAIIIYKQLDPATYKDTLLNAMAAGAGPDVFYINNNDIPAEKDKLFPLDKKQYTSADLDVFPVVVKADTIVGGELYALPLYLDSLALIYNKDLFDQAGIVYPPKSWDEFQTIVPKLANVNQRGQIIKSAAAIGGTEKTVDAGVDLLIALLMQNAPQTQNAASQSIAGVLGNKAGVDAFTFYIQFANAASTAYTWNDNQQNSIDSFAAGNTAMIFNYQSSLAAIKSKNPFMHIGIAPLPQIAPDSSTSVDYASYYTLAVSKQTKIPGQAWDFVEQATTNEAIAKAYLAAAGHPPALKSLISQVISDLDLGVFAKSALIDRSWYHANNEQIHSALNDAIGNAVSGRSSIRDSVGTAAYRIGQLQ